MADPKVTKEDRKKMVALYKKGYAIRPIAAHVGFSYTTVHRVLTQAQVPLRKRGIYTRMGNVQ